MITLKREREEKKDEEGIKRKRRKRKRESLRGLMRGEKGVGTEE